MREDHGFNPILTPVSTTWKIIPSLQRGAFCAATCSTLVCCCLLSREAAIPAGFVPPHPWQIFFSSPCSDFGTVPPEVCAAVISRGKASFQGSSTPCPCSGSSLQPTSPSHLPRPVSVTGSPEDFPGQFPARVSGQQGETQPGSAHSTSCTAPRGQMHRAGCAGAGLQPD